MGTRLYLAILLFILMPYSSLVAQVFDTIELEGMRELQTLIEEEKTGGPVLAEDEEPVIKASKELIKLEDEKYGYTGRRDFIISPKSKFLDVPLKYFGYDFFRDAPTTFAQATDIPIPTDYILGPKDEIKVILYGSENKQFTLTVTRDGEIFFPGVGPVSVAGLTFLDLKETIKKIVENQMIGTEASITLGALRSINIFVLGESYQPGMYTVSSFSTLINTIFASGGVKTTGSLRNIQVKRKGQVIASLDFYDLLLNGDTSNDIRLMPGDVVFIPPVTKTVGIAGEVERPGIYELKEGETVEDLINFAGTLKPKADLTSVEIQRIDSLGKGFTLSNIDLNQSSFSNSNLNNGDLMTIYPVVDRMGKAVLLSGHIPKAGFYPWKEGMTLQDIIRSFDDLLPMTDMHFVLIKRVSNVNQLYQTFQVDLEKLFSKLDTSQNIILKERDEIIFFPSLLTADLINVKEILGEYDNKDERQALVYTRKSFLEMGGWSQQQPGTEDIQTPQTPGEPMLLKEEETKKFFQYTIHNYCTLPENIVEEAVLAFEIDDLLTGAKVQSEVDKALEGIDIIVQAAATNIALTDNCRRQLLDPVIILLQQQATPEINRQIIDVMGNVTFPGRYPLTEGATLQDALKAAGGLRSASYTDEIEIAKRTLGLGTKQLISSNIMISLDKGLEPILLSPLGVVTVKKLSDELKVVSISGEVFFPGTYPIAPNETIISLINRAGGIKNTASLEAAIFQRESLKENELARMRKMKSEMRKNLLVSEQTVGSEGPIIDITAFDLLFEEEIDEDSIEKLGRLIIDLNSILEGTSEAIVLENGDQLIIPHLRRTVSVIGEVYVPNAHLIGDNLTMQDYINLSGGPTEFADIDNAYIIKANGSIIKASVNSRFFRSTSRSMASGDTIVLPLRLDQFSALKATTDITQIIYQMAIAAAAVNSF